MRRLSLLALVLAAFALVGCNSGGSGASQGDLEQAAAERQVGKDPNAPQTQE